MWNDLNVSYRMYKMIYSGNYIKDDENDMAYSFYRLHLFKLIFLMIFVSFLIF